ncbi:LLM class flavin-dependent oxidoreductase [Polyangium mundeleinium]|uniref:LLM class flavin-dependent oxidoreductase n=1 Tax=Polyangium mundeleinium TaxID=2995306 RepID=A0ABT5F505_9BACT|nr:LLM class flavin-dependent oxidoreductase [Polyangium mundeleinium]MDC0748227.1 LLM class flavin-dependent oxidoreductase [Polyangium mundeleinium]
MMRIPLSVLDLAPVRRGSNASEAFAESIDLSRHVEALGYRRHWFAEHHAMPGIASAAPAVLIARIAAATTTIRVGSGGVMLPNHAPLVIAEQFGTLEALFPGRIDLGIGRAPGTDPLTASALSRDDPTTGDGLPAMLDELYGFFRGQFSDDHPYHTIRAVPALGNEPPIWLLGSSGYSARLAGRRGLPFAFAHHFSQANTLPALDLYRKSFSPSAVLAQPEAMIGAIVIVADTDAEARRIALPGALAFLRVRQGKREPYPTIEEAEAYPWAPEERAFVENWFAQNIVGGPASVREQLDKLLEATRADELMVLCAVPDAEARNRSYTLLRELHG